MARIAGCTLLVCLLPVLLPAQADRGTITGLVTDASGAVVPDVEVIATHTATNVQFRTTTGPTGNYVLLALPIGQYHLMARKEGFRTYQQTGITVGVSERLRVDIQLTVGQITEAITVTGEPAVIQTESAEVGMTLNSRQFFDLPLTLGGGIRNPSTFILLQPGVRFDTGMWFRNIAGSQPYSDRTYYEGISISRGDNTVDTEVNASVDAIEEFRFISSNYSAEYSHAISGVTSYTLKSGTNQLRGNLFWFNNIEKFNARGFFAPRRTPYKQNEWGGTVGGPVLLPGLYNGRDRSFFFFAFDQFYLRQPGALSLGTVPTEAMKNGDFSEWAAAGLGSVYDPATTARDPDGRWVRQPFPGNLVPRARWSSVSSKIVPLLDKPTYAGPLLNYHGPTVGTWRDIRAISTKGDHYFRNAHHFSGMFNFTDRPQETSDIASITMPGPVRNNVIQRYTSRLARLRWTWTLKPNLINNLAGGFNRSRNPFKNFTHRQGWPEKLGLRGIEGDLFPQISFNHDYFPLGTSRQFDTVWYGFNLQDTVSWIRNSHTVKFGFEYQALGVNFRGLSNTAGTYTFHRWSSGLPGINTAGNAFASFLLGEVYSGSAYFPVFHSGNRNKYYSLWFQDDWKATSRLTVNLGLRWEVQPGFSDPNNRFAWMDPELDNPGAPGIRGAYTFAGVGPGRNGRTGSMGQTHFRDFGPRFGVALRLLPKTVVRAGYGIYFQEVNNAAGPTLGAAGFNASPSFSSPNSGATPAFRWDDGFPQNFTRAPMFAPTFNLTQSAAILDWVRSTIVPYVQQYNFTVEHQVGQTTSISVGYVGNSGRRLRMSYDFNQLHPVLLGYRDLLARPITDPAVQRLGLAEPYPGFAQSWGARGTLAQSLRRFPQYTGVGLQGANFGLSSYHSLQVKAQRDSRWGLGFTAAYTFSKTIHELTPFRNHYDRALDRSITDFDQPHIFTFSYVYELPFGRGKRFSLPAFWDKIAGGWKLSGVHNYSSGTPISISTANALGSLIFNPGNTVDVVSNQFAGPRGPGKFDPARDLWLNRAAFAAPAPYQFGNAPRYINYRIPVRKYESMAALKEFTWSERFRLQFRAESVNPVNRVVFGGPNSNFDSGLFGRISSAGGGRRVQFGLKLYY